MQGSTMFRPPIWELVAHIRADCPQGGGLQCGGLQCGVYSARATDLGPGNAHSCRVPEAGGLQCGVYNARSTDLGLVQPFTCCLEKL